MTTRLCPLWSGSLVGWGGMVAVCVAAVFVSAAAAGSSSAAVGVTVTENKPDRIVIDYRLGSYNQTLVDVTGKSCQQITLPHEAQMLTAGAPALPHVARSVIIPDDADMAVTVTNAKFYDVENVDIVPSKGNLSRAINPDDVAYTFDRQYYGTDSFFPGAVAKGGEPYILRDFRGMVVDIYPFQYNPVRRTLRVYTSITVMVSRVGTGGANIVQKSGFQRDPIVSFGGLYQGQFINLNTVYRYTPLDETGDMLIICNDDWLSNIQPLVDHKNGIGISTTAVGVSTIGSDATSIKNYIQNIYDTSNLAFVLLVGDVAQIASSYVSGGLSDPSYALLAGTDSYPDIIVGRFSAETAAQVDTQVQRSIEYESLQYTQQSWFMNATGIASSQGAGIGDNGEIDYVHMNVIRDVLLGHGYTQVDQIYDPGASATAVTNAVNDGRGLINYCGHGSTAGWTTTGFTTSNVTALVNDGKLPIIFSVACVNGQFDYAYGQCFAETWLRATHNGAPTGAVATYMSSINQDWAPPMSAQDAFNVLLTDGSYHSFGALCYGASCAMMDKYGNSSGANMFKTWHVFGDPSLRVVGVTSSVTGMYVTPTAGFGTIGPQGGPFEPASTTYTLENIGAAPIDYQVTATQPWVSIDPATGTVPGHGQAIVTIGINAVGNTLANGLYSDTVTITNTTAHEGDTTRSVSLKVGVPSPQFTWDFDADPNWALSGGEWAFGQPMGQGGPLGYPDPVSGATGTNVYGVNLSGNYPTAVGGPYYVTLGPVNLIRITEVSLRFQRWLNSDYYPLVDNTIEVRNNSTAWTEVWSNDTAAITDSSWSLQEYDISAIAANQTSVQIRWGYRILNSAQEYSGWNIDDVAIWGVRGPPAAIPGDMNCDGTVSYADVNPFITALSGQAIYESAEPDCRWLNADTNGDGVVSYADINPFVACLGVGRCQ